MKKDRPNEGDGKRYREIKNINLFYVICGVIICLAAIAEFIIWIVDASKLHMPNQLIMGTGFLTLAVGVLLYLLIRPKNYVVSHWLLWLCIIGSIVLFFVGIAQTPTSEEAAGLLGATFPV